MRGFGSLPKAAAAPALTRAALNNQGQYGPASTALRRLAPRSLAPVVDRFEFCGLAAADDDSLNVQLVGCWHVENVGTNTCVCGGG